MEGVSSTSASLASLSLPDDLLPPFIASASITNHFITTFDHKTYHIDASCSYLLSRDFFGGDFDVIADFGQYNNETEGKLISIGVRAGGNEWVNIRLTGNVSLADQEMALPFQSGDLMISGTDSEITAMSDTLTVRCNFEFKTCFIIIHGMYFGRVAGLLGSYNYEPSDDSFSPAGHELQTSSGLLNSWTISEICRPAKTSNNLVEAYPADMVNMLIYLFIYLIFRY